MNRVHALIVHGVQSIGWPGVVGLGLLAFVGGFYFSTLHPEQTRLEDLRQEVAKSGERGTRSDRDLKTPIDKLTAFYGFFPPADHLPDLLEKIYGVAAKQGLALEQGEYRAVRDNLGRLTHYQIILPVKGSYPQIRKFVAAALADVPTVSLDSIQFERQKVGDTVVDAKVKLVLYLGQRS